MITVSETQEYTVTCIIYSQVELVLGHVYSVAIDWTHLWLMLLHLLILVLEPDPRKIEKRVWEIGWGGSVHCAQNAGVLPIDSWLHAYARLIEIQTATR